MGIEQLEEIILVTGCDRTGSWTSIVFLSGQVNALAPFGVKVEGSETNIYFQLSLSPFGGLRSTGHQPRSSRDCTFVVLRFETITNIRDRFWHDVVTYSRINVYLSEDFVVRCSFRALFHAVHRIEQNVCFRRPYVRNHETQALYTAIGLSGLSTVTLIV